ncbi:MAG: class I SAM-dependent methyltransferase [Pseudomonadota bacterium]
MARDTTHDLQPRTDHDGMSRRYATLACKTAIRSRLQATLTRDYEREVLARRDEPPQHAADIAEPVAALPSYRLWSAANRAAQDRMWRVLAQQVDADYARIRAAADAAEDGARGSVNVGGVEHVPPYQTREPIHGQPGGYMLERDDDDLAAGVLYEAGGNLYALGQGIGNRDSKGERLIAFIRERFGQLEPRRILEMGCSAGGQSCDYPAAFPGAECHAIDLSPGMLKYAHARAELLGKTVHFHQRDAADTRFPGESFDLIVSHNLFHEVAAAHMPRILAECHRLLRPGGVCIHQDVPIQVGRFDAFQQFLSEWQVDHNHEPFWMDFAEADLRALMIAAGFAEDATAAEYIKAMDGPIPWYVVTAVR